MSKKTGKKQEQKRRGKQRVIKTKSKKEEKTKTLG
jgi:hypothetical protein